MITPVKDWNPFQPHRNAAAIAQELNRIPKHWALTPLQGKRPYRKNWQTEPPVKHSLIETGILHGKKAISRRTGNPYRYFNSGYGLRLGEPSHGILAIDVDGESARQMLMEASGGNIPETVGFSSGKAGRFQLLFQIPDDYRGLMQAFSRKVITEYGSIQSPVDAKGTPSELLEFRYNGCQSVLPKSHHPETGGYEWINAPDAVAVAEAPQWLLQWLTEFVAETQASKRQAKPTPNRPRRQKFTGFAGESNLEEGIEQAKQRLSIEEIYDWPGHQFQPRNSEKIVGYCPRHQSQSGTAFHVNIITGQWYCFACMIGGGPIQYRDFLQGGTGRPTGANFVAIAQELCQQAGVELAPPQPANRERQTVEQALDNWEANRDRILIREADAEADRARIAKLGETETTLEQWKTVQLGQQFQTGLNAITELTARLAARHEQDPKGKQVLTPTPIKAIKADYQLGSIETNTPPGQKPAPKTYREGQRQLAWSESAQKKRITIDRSGTGLGKTSTAVNLTPGFLFGYNNDGSPAGKLALFFQSPDNPPVTIPPNWQRLPTINENTCYRPQLRRATAAYGIAGGSNASGGKEVNPVCATCPKLSTCKEQLFKGLMQQSMEADRVYGHPQGFPGNRGQGKLAIIIDEVSTLKAVETKEIGLTDMEKLMALLQQENETWLLEQLRPIQELLRPYLAGVSPHETGSEGIDLAALQARRPSKSETEINELLYSLEQLEQTWRDRDRRQIDNKTDAGTLQVHPNWASELIGILYGQTRGAIRVYNELLKLTLPNLRNQELLAQCDTMLILDANAVAEDVALIFNIDISEIQELQQEPVATPNFQIKQLTGAQLKTANRSPTGCDRKQQIKTGLQAAHSHPLGSVDFKNLAGEDELKHHCSGEDGAIGSNRFCDRDGLVSFGTPIPNLGGALDEYQCLTGEIISEAAMEQASNFQAYLRRQINNLFIQIAGRLRANRRPDQPLVYYAVTDHDLSFFAQELGISVEQQPVWEYLPETKPNRLRQLDRLSEFLTNLWAEGKDIAQAKQNDAAAYAGCYASALSRMMKRLGGWKQLLSSLQAEINKHWDPTPSDVNQNIIETLYALMGETPSQQAKALIEAIQTYGWEPIQSHIQQLTAAGQARILAIFGAIVAEDDSWVNQIEQFLIEQLGLSYEALGIPPPITTEQL